MADLLEMERSRPISSPLSWPRCPTPLCIAALARNLHSHPDSTFAAYVLRGLREGFRIGYSYGACRLRSRGHNHPSSLANAGTVRAHISTELAADRLVGPLPPEALECVHSSPIGLVPKGHTGDRWRLIVDLSSPASSSVNDGIRRELSSLEYASLDDAVRLITHLGPGSQLVKMDLKDAYRMVPVHPDDQHLLAISWEGLTYVDRALPFGLRSAPKVFSAVADALAWVLFAGGGIRFLLHYLDDFLFIGPPGTNEATVARDRALAIFNELGVPIATHKTEGPAASVTFLGIVIDTDALQLRLPEEKLVRIRELVCTWLPRKSCTRREMESLLGHLSHAASVIRPGRLYLRQMFALLPLAPEPHHHIRLNLSARADLIWWDFFLQVWNGVALFPPGAPSVHMFSDASGSFGCGAFDPGRGWFSLRWPQQWSDVDIAVKELVPLVIAAALWGSRWRGCHVLFHVDNMAVTTSVQKLNARNPLLCQLLRCLHFYSACFCFTFTASHIPGVQNVAADALSRGNLPLFFSLFPQVPKATIPSPLVEAILGQMPNWNCPRWMQRFRACWSLESLPPPQPHTALVLGGSGPSASVLDSPPSH